MLIEIPDESSSSFYKGQVYVGLKDHVFESSSPIPHATELGKILFDREDPVKPVLLLHTDGGPDHRCNYLSVQASLIALYKSLDLDMLIAVRTAPNASWRNPPERVMSLLNLALNCIGLMRAEMEPQFENMLKSCNNMKSIREKATIFPDLEKAFVDSLEGVKILLGDLFSRLSWKDLPLQMFHAASVEDQDTMVTYLKEMDDTISLEGMSAGELRAKQNLKKFMSHCCVCRRYMFMIKKCGLADCEICLPPRLCHEDFDSLKWLPDPVPFDDGHHYKSFDSVYGTNTSEEHCPSMQKRPPTLNSHGIPFSPSAQTCKTVQRNVFCTECGKPRVLYCEKKIDRSSLIILDRILELYEYSCGSNLQELMKLTTVRVNEVLKKVFVRKNLKCENDIEVPYFSSGIFADVCVRCGTSANLQNESGVFPSCRDCSPEKLHTRQSSTRQSCGKKSKL
ncbi:uncharacterized protein LOC124114453 [Haliotis rufescens]|uniref:uncharacterized protein LOC124114453 n=1 Tax=Haliotis rufescens TaxID=6454 RepID=UPI001EAFD5BF|nr:uncharacterized protein LOC124114453 [Haliotis rufescens]